MSLTPRLDKLDKNFIINGNFDFWQRGTSISLTSNNFAADRFRYAASAPLTIAYNRSTDVPNDNSNYSLEISRSLAITPANNELGYLLYKIEGRDFLPVRNSDITISFKVKSTQTGTYCLNLRNDASDRYYIAEYTIDQADTWEAKIVKIDMTPGTASGTWEYGNLAGLQIRWHVSTGSDFFGSANSWQNGNAQVTSNQQNLFTSANSSFKLSQVMLIQGDVTPEEFVMAGRNIAEELQLCQRYYEKSYELNTAPGTVTFIGSLRAMGNVNLNRITTNIQYAVQKRAVASISIYSPQTGTINNLWRIDQNSNAGISGPFQNGTRSASGFDSAVGSANTAALHFTADAEL